MIVLLRRALAGFVFLLGVVYLSDFIFLHYRAAKGRDIHDTVKVQRYYAIAQKNNKVEFMYDEPELRECVRGLFPHSGESPCWYAGGRREERIDE